MRHPDAPATATAARSALSIAALEKVVDDGWDWKHVEDPDGPNAPSHIRASLMSPQILIPLDDGKLALGKWQGIFFCEFDGPRDRKVYVTPLS